MTGQFGDFRNQVKNIFTGSVAYDEYKEFIEARLFELEKTLKYELYSALNEGRKWGDYYRLIQVIQKWFGVAE